MRSFPTDSSFILYICVVVFCPLSLSFASNISYITNHINHHSVIWIPHRLLGMLYNRTIHQLTKKMRNTTEWKVSHFHQGENKGLSAMWIFLEEFHYSAKNICTSEGNCDKEWMRREGGNYDKLQSIWNSRSRWWQITVSRNECERFCGWSSIIGFNLIHALLGFVHQ